MDLLMARGTNRELLSVEGSQESVDAPWFLLAHFANMADMVHFHLMGVVTDAARPSQFGAGSQTDALLEQIDRRVAFGEAIALLFPVAIVIECDLTFLFPIFDLDGGDRAEPLENLAERALEFGRQCLREGELQNILDAGQVREVVSEAIVVLYSSVDTAVPKDELTYLQVYPFLFRGGLSRESAEPFGMEPVDEVSQGSGHNGFRAG